MLGSPFPVCGHCACRVSAVCGQLCHPERGGDELMIGAAHGVSLRFRCLRGQNWVGVPGVPSASHAMFTVPMSVDQTATPSSTK